MIKKYAFGFKSILLALILAAAIVLFLFWSRLPDIVATHLSKTLQVQVEIGDIRLTPQTISIDSISIDNPRTFSLPKAFSAELIAIAAPLNRYLKDQIEIDTITINNIYLGLEFDSPQGTSGNWTAIMDRTKQGNTSPSTTKETSKSVLIHKIIFNNISTELLYRNQGGKPRRLPTIKHMELHEISSEGGAPMDQILNSALGEMLKQVFIEQNLKDMLDKVFSPNKNEMLQQTFKQFKGLFNAIFTPKSEPQEHSF